jgi:predicted amidohydrolase YtcJ
LNYFNQANRTTLITGLEVEGFDFHIHAIGDRGITESVDAIAAARATNNDNSVRHRITHLEIVRKSDIDRFDDFNITADMQVTGDFTQPANWNETDFLLGSERTDSIVSLKAFYNAGARVVLSSDWDVSDLNPSVGMQNALTRAPQNLPTLAAAIEAYTIDATYVMRQEDKVGSIEVGKLADLIVLDQYLTTISITAIKATNVLVTMIGGIIVYRACNNQNLTINGAIAQDSIYTTTGSIVSNATIANGKRIEMLAKEKVELQEKFEAPQTSTLYVSMDECRNKIPE